MRTYKVGHGKPPKSTRFKKGHSGNPRGRPPKNVSEGDPDLERVLKQKIPMRVNGRQKRLSIKEAMYHTISAKGLQGDTKAFNSILAAQERQRRHRPAETPQELGPDEVEILRHHFARLKQMVSADD